MRSICVPEGCYTPHRCPRFLRVSLSRQATDQSNINAGKPLSLGLDVHQFPSPGTNHLHPRRPRPDERYPK